jgi:hypothetical protein
MKVLQFTYIKQHLGAVLGRLPFAVMKNGKIVACVIEPTTQWYSCEICGENTQNVLQYPVKDETGATMYKKLVLCDECKARYI